LVTKIKKPHSAKKATILSALVPGAGQFYNKKYWKAPIAWAGLGTCVYFISDNRTFFRALKEEAILRDADENYVNISTFTIGDLGTINGTEEQLMQIATTDQITENLDRRKQWLDLSYFAFAAVYGLQIIDANVDGHLFNYDISPDISLNVTPSFNPQLSNSAGISFTFKFR